MAGIRFQCFQALNESGHYEQAITTGFKRWRPTPKDLTDSALVYALTALAVCGRAQEGEAKAQRAPVYGDNPFGNEA